MKTKAFTVFLIVFLSLSIFLQIEFLPNTPVIVSRVSGAMGSAPFYGCDNGTVEGIQDGVNRASATGGTVIVPPGSWAFNATPSNYVNITSLNITIRGAGAFLTNLTLQADLLYDNTHMFEAIGTDGNQINITGISFFGRVGDNANYTGDSGIVLIACKDYQVTNCTFANMGSNGIALSGNGYEDYIQQGVIWNCSFYDNCKPMAYNNSGLWVRYGASTLNLSEGVYMDKFVGFGYGVGLEHSWSTDNATAKWVDNATYYWGSSENRTFIEDCYFEGHRHSVMNHGGSHVAVRNCTFDKMYVGYASGHLDQHGAYANPGGSYGGHTFEAYNNTFYNSYSEYNASRYQFQALKVRGGNVIFTQNTMYNMSWSILGSDEDGNSDFPWCQAKWNYYYDNTFIGCGDDFASEAGVWIEDNVTAINYTRAFVPASWTPYTYPHPLRAGSEAPEIPPGESYATIFFSDYEGDDDEWNNTVEQGAGASVDDDSTNVVFAGSESGEYNFSNGVSVGAYSNATFAYTFYNCSLSVWANTNTTASWRRWIELRNETDNQNIFTLLSSFTDWRVYYINGTFLNQTDAVFSYSADEWINITTMHFFNQSNGYHRVYINGSLEFDIQNLNNSGLRGAVRGIRVGAPTMSNTYTNTSIRIDNVDFGVTASEVPVTATIGVTLNEPSNNATTTTADVLFNATIGWSGSAAQNCSLWLNISGTWQSVNVNTSAVVNGSKHSLNYTFTENATYIWNFQTFNTTTEAWASSNRTVHTLFMPPLTAFTHTLDTSLYVVSTSNFTVLLNIHSTLTFWYGYNTLTIEADSNFNGTNCFLQIDSNGGYFSFTPENETELEISFVNLASVRLNGSQFESGAIHTLTGGAVYILTWGRLVAAWLPITFILGVFGALAIIVSPLYAIEKFKEKRLKEGFVIGIVLFVVGFGLVLAWLWS